MSGRSRWLPVIVVVLGLACAGLLAVLPGVRSGNVSPRANPYSRLPARPTDLESDQAPFEEVVAVCQLPAADEPLLEVPGSGHGPNCPTTQVSSLLGIAIASPHRITIGSVVPEGPAARAGIKSGDGIVKCDGQTVDCPRTLLPHLGQAEERSPVELTLRRPIRAEDGGDRAGKTESTSPETAESVDE